jgi:hypothetical protein
MKILRALAVAAGLALVVASLGAQEAAKYGVDPNYKVPRLADGHADLQGVWGNNSVTPMARPRQWKDKTLLTDAELNEMKQLAAQSVDQGGDAIFGNFIQQILDAKEKGAYKQTSYDPSTGNYNQFWMADREWDHRTSLIIDPPRRPVSGADGRGAGPPHRRRRASAHARSIGWSRRSPPVGAMHFLRRPAHPGELQQLHADSSSHPTRSCCCRK